MNFIPPSPARACVREWMIFRKRVLLKIVFIYDTPVWNYRRRRGAKKERTKLNVIVSSCVFVWLSTSKCAKQGETNTIRFFSRHDHPHPRHPVRSLHGNSIEFQNAKLFTWTLTAHRNINGRGETGNIKKNPYVFLSGPSVWYVYMDTHVPKIVKCMNTWHTRFNYTCFWSHVHTCIKSSKVCFMLFFL